MGCPHSLAVLHASNTSSCAATSGMFSAAAMSTLMGVYGPSKMHFLRYSPFDLVSRYQEKIERHSEYLLGPSIGGRSFEPAAMILLCIWLSVEDVLTGVDMMNE
ncbi:hypothetical protein Tco_0663059 [Tanacetum coccineum]